MNRPMPWIVLAAFVAVSPAFAETLDEILDKHWAAQGGKEKIAAVQTAKLTAKQIAGPQEVPITMYWKRPNKFRLEINLQGMTGVQAYDGDTAWMVMPFMGKTEPEAMTGDDKKAMDEQSDMIEGPLFNWKAKGHQAELMGKESVEGTEAWKVKLTRKSGEVTYTWLDAESMLAIKQEGKRKRGDQEFEFESSMGDYKEAGGLMFAHSMEQKAKGAPQGATFTIEKIELGVEIPDSMFKMPEKKPVEEPKPAGK